MKFNIAGIPQTGAVALRLFGGFTHGAEPSASPMIVDAMDPGTDTDVEHWATRPAFGPQVAAFAVSPYLYHNEERWYEVDVTSYVRAQQAAGKTTVTLALVTVPSPMQIQCKFQAGTEPDNQPQLIVDPD